MKMTFTAPNRPLSINEANRMHWASKRRRLEPWRKEVWLRWLAMPEKDRAELAKEGLIVVTVTLPFSRAGRRDPHNYTSTVVKALIDELVKHGLAPDDTPDFIKVEDPVLVVDKELTVTIELHKQKGTNNERHQKRPAR